MVSFELVSSTKASNLISVNKYKSDKTGLTVIIADVEGPIVNGYFCLATEAHDDDGLPHTLEHLIFLGSERYPFKGILDLLANRCLAAGTNAWTDTDHTCYTVRTAGAAGMLSLLPIYLDHILRPTLTEHGYVTEVHHIDGDGLDAGVVYCEMQGRENSAHSRCQLTLLRAMYPNSGYSSETGGIMENLRVSTNNQKVRDFHKKFYRAENMCIILTGQIEAEKVFEALEIVENDILDKRNNIEQNEEWVRPWQTIPPPPNYAEIKVQWPADIEDCGEVWFGWRGPNLMDVDGLKDLSGCAVMLRYLCETPTAPMQRELVEQDDALAGDVAFSVIENIIVEIQIVVENIPIDKMEQASKKAKEVLANIRSGEESIDMDRVERLVRKQLRECIAQLEAKPHDVIAFQCIGDMLYSENEEQFRNRLNPEEILKELLKEPASYWQGLLKRFFTENYVSIFGTPNIDLQTKMADEEEQRIQLQKEKLGVNGLLEKANILNEAMEFNERPPIPGTLANVPIPSCQDLKRHNISNWSSDSKEPCPYLDLSKLPLYARIHSLKTNFVYITLLLDMNNVPEDVRKWLPLLLNAFTESPVRRGDTLVSHTDIVAELERHTVQVGTHIGQEREGNFVIGSYVNTATFFVQCEPSEYNKVVELLWELLHATELTRERLTVIAQRLVNEVSQVRRNSNKMASDLLRDALYLRDSNLHWCSVLRQHRFLSAMLARLTAGEIEAVLEEASQARGAIVANAWLHVAGNLEGEKLSTEPWAQFGNKNEVVPKSPTIKWDSELISCNGGGGSVVGLGGVESNFLVQSSPGPLGFQHPDLAPLLLAIQYFTQLEGPMWRLIRGAGLSYGYNIITLPQEGRIVLSLYRATNPLAAYTKAKSIVEEFLSGGELDQELFESAKSSLLFEVIDQENSPADIVQQSLLFFFKKVNDTYNRELVCAIQNVTVEKAREAAARWLPNVFKADETKMSIICHPSKVKETCEAFKKVGCELEGFESLEASHFNK